jgi:ankyrin repeat protein
VNFVNVDVEVSDHGSKVGTPPPTASNCESVSEDQQKSSKGGRSAEGASQAPSSSSTVKSAAKPRAKINVNARNKFGETPLHTACKRGNLARITECLR